MPFKRIAVATVALAFAGLASAASASPIGFSVRAHAGGHLYAIDLATGLATDLGDLPTAFGDDAEGLAFIASQLFGVSGGTLTDELWDLTAPPGTKVGNTGPRNGNDAGLDAFGGVLYNLQGTPTGSSLYTLNPLTGAATFVGSSGVYADSLGIDALGQAFAVDGGATDSLYRVNLATGALTLVGSLALGNVTFQTGLAFDPLGTLWMTTHTGKIFTVNTSTGAASFVANISAGDGFQGLAIGNGNVQVQVPEPATLLLLTLGGAAVIRARKRRTVVARNFSSASGLATRD
jgi:hypothetical protein